MDITIAIFLFSFLVSAMTLGISIAAREGGLLSLVREKIESIVPSQVHLLEAQYKSLAEAYNKAYQKLDKLQMECLRLEMEAIKRKLFLLTCWQKPILSCAVCMPSMWSFVVYGTLLLAGAAFIPVVLLIISIPISTCINHFFLERYL